MTGDTAVRVEGLTRAFDGRPVIGDLELTLRPGEFTALLGRSGCGKSMLLRVLAGLDREIQGTVLVPKRRAVAFQAPRLMPWKRVCRNVLLGLTGKPELLADLGPETIAAAQQALGRSESVGRRRMPALHGGSREKLEISPNLWAGVGLVRGGAGTALVGSHADVADRIEEYPELGIEHFVLSGYPHLEEAYWFGEGVTPELATRGLLPTIPASPLLGVPATNGRPASAPGGAPLLIAGGR